MINVEEIEAEVKRYEEQLEQGKLKKPEFCAVCERKNSGFYWNGQYCRQLITQSKSYRLVIKRLYGIVCSHTFALLPNFVIKFYRYSRNFIEWTLKKLQILSYEKVADLIMDSSERYVSTLTLYFWKKKFS